MELKMLNARFSRIWGFSKRLGVGVALSGVLLWGKGIRPVSTNQSSIDNRVLAVRHALQSKLDASGSAHRGLQLIQEKLTRSEMQVAQWGNWNNWGNWANWNNWNNWSQFGNVFNNY